MRNLWYFVIVLILSTMVCSCEKESNDITLNDVNKKNFNEKYEQTGDPYDYVIVNPEWQLLEANYEDQFGNIGELYVNKTNPIETFFYIKKKSQLKTCFEMRGFWENVAYYDPETRTTYYRQTCIKTDKNQNCGIMICMDKLNKITSVSIYSLDNL